MAPRSTNSVASRLGDRKNLFILLALPILQRLQIGQLPEQHRKHISLVSTFASNPSMHLVFKPLLILSLSLVPYLASTTIARSL